MNHPGAGPILMISGLLLFAAQVYVFATEGTLSARLIGYGVGLLGVGAMASWYARSERRRASEREASDEMPTADEFDAAWREVDSSEDEPG